MTPSTTSATETATETRTCRGPCGRTFPLILKHFHPDGHKRDGSVKFKSRCRVCVDEQRYEYRARLKREGKTLTRPKTVEHVAMLPSVPLGERVARAIQQRCRTIGDDPARQWAMLNARLGLAEGSVERRVYGWTHESTRVRVTVAHEVLDALDLLLVDAYTDEQLAALPPVELD